MKKIRENGYNEYINLIWSVAAKNSLLDKNDYSINQLFKKNIMLQNNTNKDKSVGILGLKLEML